MSYPFGAEPEVAECGGVLRFDEGYFCEHTGCVKDFAARIASLESQVSRMQVVVDAATEAADRYVEFGGVGTPMIPAMIRLVAALGALSSIDQEATA